MSKMSKIFAAADRASIVKLHPFQTPTAYKRLMWFVSHPGAFASQAHMNKYWFTVGSVVGNFWYKPIAEFEEIPLRHEQGPVIDLPPHPVQCTM